MPEKNTNPPLECPRKPLVLTGALTLALFLTAGGIILSAHQGIRLAIQNLGSSNAGVSSLLEQQQKRIVTASAILVSGSAVLLVLWLIVIRRMRMHWSERAEWEAELKESDEINRTLLASLPQSVYFKNRNLIFQGANGAFARELISDPADIIGKKDEDFFPLEQVEKNRNEDIQVMKERQILVFEERRHHAHKDRFLEVIKAPVVNDEGEVIGLVGLITDISERKQADEKLREFAAKLEQNNRELQEFAYVASHDLQEPLRKVRAFSDRLNRKHGESLNAEGRDYLERIHVAAQRMQLLIEALLEYSRITTRAQPFEPTDLAVVTGEVLSDLEIRIEQVRGRVCVGYLPVIEADATQMRQLMQNLIGNALKFSKPGEPPTLHIESAEITPEQIAEDDVSADLLHKQSPQRKFCRLTVSDNGIGFEEKYLDRIFQVFQRLHGRSAYEGAGVGLAICRKIALRHGGDITARSRPGQGSTFFVTLPIKQNPAIKEHQTN